MLTLFSFFKPIYPFFSFFNTRSRKFPSHPLLCRHKNTRYIRCIPHKNYLFLRCSILNFRG